MIKNLLKNLTEDEQRALFSQFKKLDTTRAVEDESDDSFHSAASCEFAMQCDASPFVLPSPSTLRVANLKPVVDPEV
jgi:hypothetical protein